MKFSMTEHGFFTETSYGSLNISPNDEYGFRPFQLLIASIAVCSGGILRNILEKMRMPTSEIVIDVKEVKRNPEFASRVEKIHLHFIIKNNRLTDEKMSRIFDLVQKNCSMIQSVQSSIEIVETYEIISE